MLLLPLRLPLGAEATPLGLLTSARLSLLDIFFSLPSNHRCLWVTDLFEMISRFKVFYAVLSFAYINNRTSLVF